MRQVPLLHVPPSKNARRPRRASLQKSISASVASIPVSAMLEQAYLDSLDPWSSLNPAVVDSEVNYLE